ncbi:MAG: tetratricopeptide repeat protein [Vicinamibacterales bacterium]
MNGSLAERPVLRALTIAVIVITLWSVATVVADRYRTQKVQRAVRSAVLGRSELESGRADEAIRHFREAVALEPGITQYRLDLAGALLELNQTDEATNYLREVLRQDPVNGPANLSLARIHDTLGSVEEAETAFYRALYGRWAADEEEARRRARLELVEFLTRTANRDRVPAELVQIATAFPGDLLLQLRAGRTLLDMGFPEQAALILNGAATRFADPGDAFALLAEAHLDRGDFGGAVDAARQALRIDPTNKGAAARRDLASAAAAMDPTQLRLSVRERTSRTQRLLGRIRALLETCQPASLEDNEDAQLSRDIDAWLSNPYAVRVEQLETGLALLESAAGRVTGSCAASRDDEALALVIRRISNVPAT